MQSSIATIARSMGEPELAAQVDTMIRNMEGRETPLRYEALMSATSALLTARPESFKNAEEIHKRLKELADISRSPEVFGLATQAYSKVLSEGRLDMQEINASQGYPGCVPGCDCRRAPRHARGTVRDPQETHPLKRATDCGVQRCPGQNLRTRRSAL